MRFEGISQVAYKDMLETKLNYVNRKNERDKQTCCTLSSKQHDTLAWLASVRHNCKIRQDDWWCDENENCASFWVLLPDNSGMNDPNGEINKRLKECGLKPIKWHFDTDDYLTESIAYELGLSAEKRESERKKTLELPLKVNEDIINYLRKIDKKHGTHYCPTEIAAANYVD